MDAPDRDVTQDDAKQEWTEPTIEVSTLAEAMANAQPFATLDSAGSYS